MRHKVHLFDNHPDGNLFGFQVPPLRKDRFGKHLKEIYLYSWWRHDMKQFSNGAPLVSKNSDPW